MIKFVALIRANGKGTVLNVAAGEIRRVVEREKATGSFILGEYSDPRHGARAVELGLRGWRRPVERKTGT
jgi:hypothetical protein